MQAQVRGCGCSERQAARCARLSPAAAASHNTTAATPTSRPALAPPPRSQGRTLLVFDFDWSLAEENSDTWVLQQLGAEEFYKAGRAAGTPWTKLMDQCLQVRRWLARF